MDGNTPNAEFHEALAAIEDSYRAGLRAFCVWVAAEWSLPDEAHWHEMFQEPYPGDAYRNGWAAAIDALPGALDSFLDEHV